MTDAEKLIFNEGELPHPTSCLRLIRAFPFLLKLPLVRALLLRGLVGLNGCKVSPGFYAVVPENLIASNANINDTVFINYAPVTIGNGAKFSGENIFLTSSHDFRNFTKVVAKPITIGTNVWITYRCIILGGVSIGDNSVIGAGSVVVSDIPANVLAAGNPCRVIREL